MQSITYRIVALAWLCLTPALSQTTYTIQTVAGSNLVGDGVSALNAQLSDAEGLTLDTQGNVYIADPSNHRVRKVNASGMIQTVAGSGTPDFFGDGGPASAARLNAPYGVAADRAGNLYIADLGNNRVRKVGPDGVITTIAGTGQAGSAGDGGPASAAQLNAPRNLAVDGFGGLYIAEFNGHRIRLVTPDGLIQTVAGTGSSGSAGEGVAATSAQLSYPAGIAVDFTGTLYIADSGNQKIRKVFAGLITTVLLPTLSTPTGVTGDGSGGIYIADSGNLRILRRTAGNVVFTVASALSSARDVSIDLLGNLLIADGHRVRLLSPMGFSTTFAGDGTFGYGGDGGPALAAVLNGPGGIAVGPDGSLYIADEHNHRVRVVSSAGVISTIAGTGIPAISADGLPAIRTALDAPAGLLLDSTSALWIGEYFGNRVRKLPPGGTIQPVAGNGTAGFNGDFRAATTAELQAPDQTALDAAGNLYIADSGNHRIRKVTQGMISTYAGTGSPGFAGDGGQAASATLNLPRGVAVDAAGNLFIADTNNNCIRKVTPGGLISTVAGAGAFPLSFPRSVMVGFDQNLYIADTGNQRILRLTPAGDLATIAGTGAAGFGGDGGDSLSAQFTNPVALAMDAAGNLYVADFDNNRIRKLTPSTTAIAAPIIALPSTAALVNAASLRAGPVAPGEMLSILADGIGPAVGVFGVDTLLSETQVLFDGQPAPLIYVQQSQIKVQVPYEVATLASTHVQVFHSGQLQVDVTLPVTPAAPGIFTLSGGTGPAQIFLQDGSLNSATNPADPGSVVTIFATGEGARSTDPNPQPLGHLDLRIGGRPAEIVFVAEGSGAPGILQINARIPTIVGSGAIILSLAVDSALSQDGVTVFVK
jgi:uncharacterized protein (TIGR03437 family)